MTEPVSSSPPVPPTPTLDLVTEVATVYKEGGYSHEEAAIQAATTGWAEADHRPGLRREVLALVTNRPSDELITEDEVKLLVAVVIAFRLEFQSTTTHEWGRHDWSILIDIVYLLFTELVAEPAFVELPELPRWLGSGQDLATIKDRALAEPTPEQ